MYMKCYILEATGLKMIGYVFPCVRRFSILVKIVDSRLIPLSACIFPGHSVPSVLQSTFQAQACEELFKHLCISGTPKIRLHAGLLLVQLCGGERWWGQFLSNVLQELYNSEQLLIFPQDRYDSFWSPQVQFNYYQVLIMKVTKKFFRDVFCCTTSSTELTGWWNQRSV